MVMCTSATWGLPRRLSHDTSNAVHRSGPKKERDIGMPIRPACPRGMGNSM